MMVCKGWKGGTIKKYPTNKEKCQLMFQKKVKIVWSIKIIYKAKKKERTFGLGYDGL